MQSHLDIASSLSHCFKQIKSALQKLEVTPLKVIFDNAINLNPAGYCQAAEKITFQMFWLDNNIILSLNEQFLGDRSFINADKCVEARWTDSINWMD